MGKQREKIKWRDGKKNTKTDKKYSQHLNGSMKKIDKVFRIANDHGIAISEKKEKKDSENANTGLVRYRDTMQKLMEDVYKRFNVSDVTKITSDMVETLINERIDNFYLYGKTGEVDNVKNILSAVNAFQVLTQKTSVFKEPLEFLDTKEKRKELNEMKFDRAMILSNTKKSDFVESKRISDTIVSVGNVRGKENRQLSSEIIQLGMYSGGRISNMIGLESKDISADGKTIIFRDDKGDKTRIANVFTREGQEFVKGLKQRAERANRERVFEPRKSDGTIKSTKSTRKMVEHYTSQAAKTIGATNEVTVTLEKGVRPHISKGLDIDSNQFVKTEKYTPHSSRKAYANELCEYYYKEISEGRFQEHFERQIKNEIAINSESARQKYIDKYNNEVKYANNNRKDKSTYRDLTDAEKALYLASVDMGHYRISVMSCYIDRKEFTRTHK